MPQQTLQPSDIILGALKAKAVLNEKKGGFLLHQPQKPLEPYRMQRTYTTDIKIVALLPLMHDAQGQPHITGKIILVYVRRTIATTPKNSDGILLSFRPMRMIGDWPTRLTRLLYALHRLCDWRMTCPKDGERMIPGVRGSGVIYTHTHPNGKASFQKVPAHIEVSMINKYLLRAPQ